MRALWIHTGDKFLRLVPDQHNIHLHRHFYPKKEGAYTFWTYMMNARAKNTGWRLDYFLVSSRLTSKLADCVIRSEVYGSDHCPLTLLLEQP